MGVFSLVPSGSPSIMAPSGNVHPATSARQPPAHRELRRLHRAAGRAQHTSCVPQAEIYPLGGIRGRGREISHSKAAGASLKVLQGWLIKKARRRGKQKRNARSAVAHESPSRLRTSQNQEGSGKGAGTALQPSPGEAAGQGHVKPPASPSTCPSSTPQHPSHQHPQHPSHQQPQHPSQQHPQHPSQQHPQQRSSAVPDGENASQRCRSTAALGKRQASRHTGIGACSRPALGCSRQALPRNPGTPSTLPGAGTIPATAPITAFGERPQKTPRATMNTTGTPQPPQTCWNSPSASLVLLISLCS